ncbi:hypothetical protein SBA7_700002 [Candidatus Sulfotelmatobacter sp. SbA7]|nr:hypothetical protein SBA7_700002 [Candidatus Sulfotelmatobacter sp. SbA7]
MTDVTKKVRSEKLSMSQRLKPVPFGLLFVRLKPHASTVVPAFIPARQRLKPSPYNALFVRLKPHASTVVPAFIPARFVRFEPQRLKPSPYNALFVRLKPHASTVLQGSFSIQRKPQRCEDRHRSNGNFHNGPSVCLWRSSVEGCA